MTYGYFGVVTKVMESGAGELRGLARFEKGARDLHFLPERRFEPDGNVFVARLPPYLKVGAPVLFDAEENPRPKGPARWWVKPGEGGRSRLELYGFAILSASVSVVDPDAVRPLPCQDRVLAAGLRLYLRYETERGPCLRGPWTAKDGNLFATESELHEWPDRSWPTEDHFEAHDGSWEILLSALEPNSGLPLDRMAGDELVGWFLKQAEQIPRLAEILASLHRDAKKLLRSKFDELSADSSRRLFKIRFERVLSILETLQLGRSELERIAIAPAFERLWKDALHVKREELEEKAKAGIAHRLHERQAIEEGIRRLQLQRSALESEIEKLRAKVKKSRTDISTLERRHDGLETYIGENQKRLLNDARALAPLLVGRGTGVPGGTQWLARIPALENSEQGLAPTNGLQGVTIWACRLTLLLDPFSAREIAAAQGRRMFVLQVEPHWLCFDDAWRAGLRSIFEAVVGDGIATLLHIQDLDRSPPELWLRPVLDLASGLRDALVEGEREWPEALRITASLSPGPPHHPLGTWLLRHFGTPEPVVEQPDEGSVIGDHARQQRGRAARGGPEPLGAAGLEPFVEREVKVVAELLAKGPEGGGEEDRSYFEARAREIRRVWPLTFGRWP